MHAWGKIGFILINQKNIVKCLQFHFLLTKENIKHLFIDKVRSRVTDSFAYSDYALIVLYFYLQVFEI